MLDTFKIYEELAEILDDKAARKLTKIMTSVFESLEQSVTKVEFNELKQTASELYEIQKQTMLSISELTEAQKRTEERLETLTIRMDKLAEVQKKTEEILNELTEAQKRTEERLESLTKRMDELAEAQRRTEERLDSLSKRMEELAEAQKKTEERLNELAEAQRKTEETLNKLIKRVDNIEEQLGGLSMVVGYSLEDKLYPHIPNFLEKAFAFKPKEYVLRKNIEYPNGKFDEVNIYAFGEINGKSHIIVGECKAQPGKKDIDRFMKMTERVKNYFNIDVIPVMIGYHYHPTTEKYINQIYPKLKYLKSYEIEYGVY